jgi:hypothetical protein
LNKSKAELITFNVLKSAFITKKKRSSKLQPTGNDFVGLVSNSENGGDKN